MIVRSAYGSHGVSDAWNNRIEQDVKGMRLKILASPLSLHTKKALEIAAVDINSQAFTCDRPLVNNS